MLSPLRNRFGIPGVISVIALVFAMFGGAYAATDSGDGGKATASAKAKQGPRGPRGKTGKTGPAGPAGPQGPAGAKGDTGAAGSNGTNGKDGTDGVDGTPGQSVTGAPIAAGGACGANLTGVKYTLGATSTNVCNGATGYTEELPSGATETGTWWVIGNSEEQESYFPISFPIPLSEADAEVVTAHIWRESKLPAERPDACLGTPEKPEAEPGALCLYVPLAAEGAGTVALPGVFKPDLSGEGVGTSGALLRVAEVTAVRHMGGTFAVTAP